MVCQEAIMGFRGEASVFSSPAEAVAGMVSRLGVNRARMEACPLTSVRGRILAETIFADRDSPAFDYSAMDGYAIRLSDFHSSADPISTNWSPASGFQSNSGQISMPVVGEVRIGSAPAPMPSFPACIRIVTGAGIPIGADAVIKREDVVECGTPGGVTEVTLIAARAAAIRSGDNIRRRAENVQAGASVLKAGSLVSSASIGTLAAVGCTMPQVYSRLRVAIITTGDELVSPDAMPTTFQIRNSNGPALHSLFAAQEWLEVVSATHVNDDGSSLSATLQNAMKGADAIVLSGGVSMGHRDPVRTAIDQLGAEVVFHGLPQRPGKPMLGAVLNLTDDRRIPLFGLPGNPISAMVTAVRIVMPVFASCAGMLQFATPTYVAVENHDGKSLDMWWHRLVRVNSQGTAELVDGRGSGDIMAASRSDGFIELPPHTAETKIPHYSYYPWPT